MKQLLKMIVITLIGATNTPCPQTQVSQVPMGIDPNLINFKLLCVVEVQEGTLISKGISACDPDNDRMSFSLLQAPETMELQTVDSNEVTLTWRATRGVHYVDVQVKDEPIMDEDALFDRGSIVFIIRARNRPPVLGGCR